MRSISGTDTQISIQLSDLVTRKSRISFPDGRSIVENPALHLTAIYFMQEMRRQTSPEPTEELKELQEEMLAHYRKGTFLVVRAGGWAGSRCCKQKDGTIYQPIFTDMLELQKFSRGKKMKTAVFPAARFRVLLAEAAKGVVINPFGVNVQLQIAKR